jgi:hypothetical protein
VLFVVDLQVAVCDLQLAPRALECAVLVLYRMARFLPRGISICDQVSICEEVRTFSLLRFRQLRFQLLRVHTVDRKAALSGEEGVSDILFDSPLVVSLGPVVRHKQTSSTSSSTLRLIASSRSGVASGGKSLSNFCLAALVTFAIMYVRSFDLNVSIIMKNGAFFE